MFRTRTIASVALSTAKLTSSELALLKFPGSGLLVSGLKPCVNSKSVAPVVVSKSQLVKRKNNITLKDPEYIVWKCGVSRKPLVDL